MAVENMMAAASRSSGSWFSLVDSVFCLVVLWCSGVEI